LPKPDAFPVPAEGAALGAALGLATGEIDPAAVGAGSCDWARAGKELGCCAASSGETLGSGEVDAGRGRAASATSKSAPLFTSSGPWRAGGAAPPRRRTAATPAKTTRLNAAVPSMMITGFRGEPFTAAVAAIPFAVTWP
jgi:hypothetical protein